MRYLIGFAVLVACGLALLWREARTLGRDPSPAAARSTPAARDDRDAPGPDRGAPAPAAPGVPAAALPSPPGGIRAWSATATPTDGPDPFAPVPQVRSLAETRAGLDEPAGDRARGSGP